MNTILFLQLFDRFFKLCPQVKLHLVLCLPTDCITFGIDCASWLDNFQLSLQFVDNILVCLYLFFAVDDFFFTDAEHVLCVELLLLGLLGYNLACLALKCLLNNMVKFFNLVAKLEVD